MSRSATQIVAFLINAAKGTPIASFIGAPELLSALTDITSFSSGRVTTYSLLLVFYTAVVMGVVWLCSRFRRFLERSHAAWHDRRSSDFLPRFLAGMAVNFEIAAISIGLGLALGVAARRRCDSTAASSDGSAASMIALMRAAPTFVVMFFLLNAIPRDATLFGVPFALSGVMTVALSLVPYAAAYVADAAARRGSTGAAARRLAACCSCPT